LSQQVARKSRSTSLGRFFEKDQGKRYPCGGFSGEYCSRRSERHARRRSFHGRIADLGWIAKNPPGTFKVLAERAGIVEGGGCSDSTGATRDPVRVDSADT
jgi:hypothetical protein